MNPIRQLLLSIFIFFLLFFETEEIGPLTFSQFWKIPLFLYLFFQVLIVKRVERPSFIKWSYARAVKHLFSKGLFVAPLADYIEFIRYMFFPLLFEFFKRRLHSVEEVNKILIAFAQFVVLSGIPFVFLGLKSRGNVIFETEEVGAYTGVFQGPHAASTTTAIALILLIFFLKRPNNSFLFKSFNSLLVVLGVYFLFLTFVRTGYAMFAVGMVVLFMPKKIQMNQIIGGAIVISFLIFGFLYLLETNEFFYNRIFDIRNGRETAAGSGRLLFWKGTVDAWMNGNFLELLFGYGMEGFKDELQRTSGYHVVAHNEFFNQLGINGFVGIFIFFGFMLSLLKYIYKNRLLPTYRLALASFFVYFSLMMTQGGMWFPVDFFMALIFVRLYKESEMEIQNVVEDSVTTITHQRQEIHV